MASYTIKEVKFIKGKYYFVDEEGIIDYILKKEKACGTVTPVSPKTPVEDRPTLTIFRDEDGIAKKAIFNQVTIFAR